MRRASSFLSSSWWTGKAWLAHVEGFGGGKKRAAECRALLETFGQLRRKKAGMDSQALIQ